MRPNERINPTPLRYAGVGYARRCRGRNPPPYYANKLEIC